MVERIVFGEHDRRSVGPMFEELLLIPEQAIQVRQSKHAESAPQGDHMGRRDHVDRVQLNVAQVAYHGKGSLRVLNRSATCRQDAASLPPDASRILETSKW